MSNFLEKHANKIANVLYFGLFIMPLLLLVFASFVLNQQEKFYNQRFDYLIQQIKHCKSSENKEISNF